MSSRAVVTIHTAADRDQIVRWAKNVEVGTVVEFRKKSRSAEQNSKLWAMLSEVSEQVIWYGQKLDAEDWKDLFTAALRNARVVPGLDKGSYVPLGMRTSQMTIAEMGDLIELIYAFGADPAHPVKFKDQDTGEAPPSASPVDDETQTPPEVSSSEPSDIANTSGGSHNSNAADDAPASAHEGSATPPTSPVQAEPSNLFEPTFNIPAAELQHLKDFARKSLDDAASKNDPPAKEASIERMRMNYLDAVESKDARQAIEAMGPAFDAVIKGKRTRAQAASYIAADLLGCAVVELEGRR